MSIWANAAKIAVTQGKKALTTYQAGKAVQQKKPVAKKPAPKPMAKPVVLPSTPTNTYNVLGMQVNKTTVHVLGGLALFGAAVGIGRKMSKN